MVIDDVHTPGRPHGPHAFAACPAPRQEQRMSGTEYGLFLPNAAGGWLISDTAPYPPADYDYNKRVARLGGDSAETEG